MGHEVPETIGSDAITNINVKNAPIGSLGKLSGLDSLDSPISRNG